jgi:hypothetical protein
VQNRNAVTILGHHSKFAPASHDFRCKPHSQERLRPPLGCSRLIGRKEVISTPMRDLLRIAIFARSSFAALWGYGPGLNAHSVANPLAPSPSDREWHGMPGDAGGLNLGSYRHDDIAI